MKPRQHSIFRRSSSLLIAVSFAMSLTAAQAADQTWLPAGPTNDWNTTDLNWDAGVAWTQTNNAIFGGAGETVTLTEGIAAGGLTFNSSGYTLAGNTLTLAAAAAINTGANNATIASLIAGPSFSKSGAGELVLTGASNYAGALTINAGTLKVVADSLSGAAVNLSTSGAKLNLGYQTATPYAWAPNSAVALNGAYANNVIDGNSGTRWSSTTQYCWIYADLGSTQSLGQFAINFEGAYSSAFKVQVSNDASTWTDATGVLNAGGAGLKIYDLNSGTAGRYVRVESTLGVATGWGTSIWEMTALGAMPAGTYNLGSLGGAAGTTVDMATIANILKVGSANTDTTFAGTISGGLSATLEKVGTGTLILSGANDYTGATTITAGTLEVTRPTGYTTTSSGYAVAAAATFTFNMPTPGYDMTLASPLSGTGSVNLVNNGYSLHINANNSAFTGTVTTSGTSMMFFDTTTAASANTAYVIDMSGGGGYYGALCTHGVASGSTIHLGSLSGTTAATEIASGHSDGGGTITWSIGALGTDTTFAGYFGDFTKTTALTKVGSGELTLTGNSIHTGATTVNAGTLALTGSATLARSPITVGSSGTLALADAASVATTITLAEGGRLDTSGLSDDFTLASGQALSAGRSSGFAEDVLGNLALGDGTLHIGGPGSTAGTLTQTGKLTLGGGGALTFDLATTDTLGAGVNDLIAVTGDLALAGSTIIDVNKLSGTLSSGSYTLISWTGDLTGTVLDNLTLGLPDLGRQSYQLAQSGNSVVLNVSGVPANLVWAGADYSNPTYWDQNITANWIGLLDGKFVDGDNVTFNDSATATTVELQGAMAPVSVTFSNTTAKPYTIGGTGSIDGLTGITKSGDGLVTITNDNTMSGVVALNAGITSIATGDGLGTGAITFDGGTLAFTGTAAAWSRGVTLNAGGGGFDITAAAGTLTASSAMTGAGALTKAGDGTLVLGGANNYTGATSITKGTLEVTRPAFYTTTSSGYDVAAGATFTFRMPSTGYDMYLSSPLTGTGTVSLINNGWSMLLDADNSAFAGTVTTSGSSNLFLTRASATSANAAYVIETTGWAPGWGGLCTQSIASGSTIHLGSLSGTNAATKIASGSGGSGTITWSVGALGTDTTFAGYFGDYYMVTALTKVGSGTLTLTGANTYTGNTNVNGGTLVLRQQKAGGTITTASGATTEWQQTADMGWAFGLQPGSVTFAGAGRVNKTGAADSYMYGDHASGGTFRVNQSAGAVFDMQAGRFDQGGGGGGFIGTNLGSLNVASGATIGLWGSNATVDALTGAGTLVNGENNTKTLTVGAANHTSSVDNPYFTGTSATFSGVLANGTVGTLALTKTGSGTQILTGANGYSGATTVNAGTLAINNTTDSGTGSSAVTVQTTATLAGTGSIAGSVSVAAGGFVAPGNAGIGTLTVASAALTGTYQCQLDVASGDQVIVSGALTVNTGAVIAVSTLGTPAAASYIIATYGSLGGGAPTVTGIPGGYVLDTATAGQIKLVKSAGGFSDWADSWLGLTDKTPGGDPDGDGISNVMEYVIGGDPRVSSTSYLPGQAIDGTDLVLSYERSDASEADTTQTGQWSTNLTDWNDLAPVLVNENAADPDSMEIRIPLTNAVGGKLFGRLNVTKP